MKQPGCLVIGEKWSKTNALTFAAAAVHRCIQTGSMYCMYVARQLKRQGTGQSAYE